MEGAVEGGVEGAWRVRGAGFSGRFDAPDGHARLQHRAPLGLKRRERRLLRTGRDALRRLRRRRRRVEAAPQAVGAVLSAHLADCVVLSARLSEAVRGAPAAREPRRRGGFSLGAVERRPVAALQLLEALAQVQLVLLVRAAESLEERRGGRGRVRGTRGGLPVLRALLRVEVGGS